MPYSLVISNSPKSHSQTFAARRRSPFLPKGDWQSSQPLRQALPGTSRFWRLDFGEAGPVFVGGWQARRGAGTGLELPAQLSDACVPFRFHGSAYQTVSARFSDPGRAGQKPTAAHTWRQFQLWDPQIVLSFRFRCDRKTTAISKGLGGNLYSEGGLLA